MRTEIHPRFANQPSLDRAEAIVRSCVHCGFCTAVCPTYQLLGDEADSPRGRIVLINDLLETGRVTEVHETHLDRCLTCRSCETHCPSGVAYTDLLDIAKGLMLEQPARSKTATLGRDVLLRLLKWQPLMRFGFWLLRRLPTVVRRRFNLPVIMTSARGSGKVGTLAIEREVILLGGCIQSAATPEVNEAAAALLEVAGIGVNSIKREACCGALAYHLGRHDEGRADMRRLIRQIEQVGDTRQPIVSTASGCGISLKSLPKHFEADDPDFTRATAIAARVVDVSELLIGENIAVAPSRVAFHRPCTLKHGQGLGDELAAWLTQCGLTLIPLVNPPGCCGSAGTYSLLQSEMANSLRERMMTSLTEHAPDVIVTANIGCQLHLSSGTEIPVMHWLELVWQQYQLGLSRG